MIYRRMLIRFLPQTTLWGNTERNSHSRMCRLASGREYRGSRESRESRWWRAGLLIKTHATSSVVNSGSRGFATIQRVTTSCPPTLPTVVGSAQKA